MKARIAFVSVVLSILCASIALATYQPLLQRLFTIVRVYEPDSVVLSQVARLLPLLFVGNVLIIGAIFFSVLFVFVALPLLRTEDAIRQIAAQQGDVVLSSAGPLAPRLGVALQGLRGALATERDRNQKQLESLRLTNERLARLQAELVAADRMATVGKLAAGVAHEVGNPLAGILGYVSVLRMKGAKAAGDDAHKGEQVEVLDRVEYEVQRIDAIVRSLLDLGRPSRGKAQPIDVRPIIDSAVRLLSAGELAHLKVQVDAPESLWLRAETGPLSQVLINLLINAAQLMGEGVITVRAQVVNDRGSIRVEDQGPGLSPEVAARLFEPFFTTKAPGKGTGLGLAISKHLLSQFDGDLTADNLPSGGAVFTIFLPVP